MPVVKPIKKFTLKLQEFFAAAAFAEAGEFETAKIIRNEQKRKLQIRKILGRTLTVTRAEKPASR